MANNPFSVLKNDSEDLGFAEGCLICAIVSLDEFKEWIYLVIEQNEDYPNFFFDFLDFKNRREFLSNYFEIVGYAASSGLNSKESRALNGIGFLRFDDYQDDHQTKEQAIRLLTKYPKPIDKFKKNFPFIDVDFSVLESRACLELGISI